MMRVAGRDIPISVVNILSSMSQDSMKTTKEFILRRTRRVLDMRVDVVDPEKPNVHDALTLLGAVSFQLITLNEIASVLRNASYRMPVELKALQDLALKQQDLAERLVKALVAEEEKHASESSEVQVHNV